jgi:hypothetical protein
MVQGIGIPGRSGALPGEQTANLLGMLKNCDKSVSRASLLLSLSAGASKEAMDARTRRKLGRFIILYPVCGARGSVSSVCSTERRRCDPRITEVRDLPASCSQFRLRVGSSHWYRKDGSYVES